MEDLDLCYRSAAAGWVTWYEPSVAATHVKGGHERPAPRPPAEPRLPLRDGPLLPAPLRARAGRGVQRRGLRRRSARSSPARPDPERVQPTGARPSRRGVSAEALDRCLSTLARPAPVAQWIEQRFPKPRAQVRFLSGALAALMSVTVQSWRTLRAAGGAPAARELPEVGVAPEGGGARVARRARRAGRRRRRRRVSGRRSGSTRRGSRPMRWSTRSSGGRSGRRGTSSSWTASRASTGFTRCWRARRWQPSARARDWWC